MGVADWVGAELCVDGALWTGDELWVEPADTAVPLPEVPALDAGEVLVCVVLGLAFGGGACSAGTAPAVAKAVMLAC